MNLLTDFIVQKLQITVSLIVLITYQSKRTTLSEVWDALDNYNQIKEDIEPFIEKELKKKQVLIFQIEKK